MNYNREYEQFKRMGKELQSGLTHIFLYFPVHSVVRALKGYLLERQVIQLPTTTTLRRVCVEKLQPLKSPKAWKVKSSNCNCEFGRLRSAMVLPI